MRHIKFAVCLSVTHLFLNCWTDLSEMLHMHGGLSWTRTAFHILLIAQGPLPEELKMLFSLRQPLLRPGHKSGGFTQWRCPPVCLFVCLSVAWNAAAAPPPTTLSHIFPLREKLASWNLRSWRGLLVAYKRASARLVSYWFTRWQHNCISSAVGQILCQSVLYWPTCWIQYLRINVVGCLYWLHICIHTHTGV